MDWEAIKHDYLVVGLTAVQVSELYGVNPNTVYTRARNEDWPHKSKNCSSKERLERQIYMNQVIFKQKLESLSSYQKKVFNCVPIQDTWTSRQIIAELGRTGCNTSLKSVEGILRILKEKKLITGSEFGYQRAKGAIIFPKSKIKKQYVQDLAAKKEAKNKKCEEIIVPKNDNTVKSAKKTPLEILDELRKELKNLEHFGLDFSQRVKGVEDMFETAALEITEYVEDIEDGQDKVKKLKEILGIL